MGGGSRRQAGRQRARGTSRRRRTGHGRHRVQHAPAPARALVLIGLAAGRAAGAWRGVPLMAPAAARGRPALRRPRALARPPPTRAPHQPRRLALRPRASDPRRCIALSALACFLARRHLPSRAHGACRMSPLVTCRVGSALFSKLSITSRRPLHANHGQDAARGQAAREACDI